MSHTRESVRPIVAYAIRRATAMELGYRVGAQTTRTVVRVTEAGRGAAACVEVESGREIVVDYRDVRYLRVPLGRAGQ